MFEFYINLVHQEGFEPPTFRFVAEHSIQLSYWCIHYIIIAFGIIFKMFLKILQKNLQKLLQIFKICAIIYKRWAKNNISRCSAVGSARGLGPWGRRFDPCHLDHTIAILRKLKKIAKVWKSINQRNLVNTLFLCSS